jgi:hypothetical protein
LYFERLPLDTFDVLEVNLCEAASQHQVTYASERTRDTFRRQPFNSQKSPVENANLQAPPTAAHFHTPTHPLTTRNPHDEPPLRILQRHRLTREHSLAVH